MSLTNLFHINTGGPCSCCLVAEGKACACNTSALAAERALADELVDALRDVHPASRNPLMREALAKHAAARDRHNK